MADRKRCCCNCGRNIRHEVASYGIECYCEIDGHRIGYIECFEGWCRRWKSGPGKDVRACVREADALGISHGQYVAAGLDQVAWEGQRQTRPRTGSPIQMDHTHGGDADGSDDL